MRHPRETVPERWSVQAGAAAVARLDIPPDAKRERRFEVAISMTVRALDNATAPWHELRVQADGQLQWHRRIGTQQPSPFDGLEYRFQRSVAVGQTLRLAAFSECSGARRLQLRIEADEA